MAKSVSKCREVPAKLYRSSFKWNPATSWRRWIFFFFKLEILFQFPWSIGTNKHKKVSTRPEFLTEKQRMSSLIKTNLTKLHISSCCAQVLDYLAFMLVWTHLSSTPVWRRGRSSQHLEGPLPRWDTTPRLHSRSSSGKEDVHQQHQISWHVYLG